MMHTVEPRSELRVLIVEDHLELRRALRDYLCVLLPDARLVEAGCVEDALALVAAERPQVVLIAIDLSGMDGIETTRRIKARAPGTCVLALSSHDDEAHRAAAAAAGAAAFIAKRNLPGALVQRLDALVPGITQFAAG